MTFEIDESTAVHVAAGVCWSAVRPRRSGRATVRVLVARTHAAGVEPWAPGEKRHWLRIIPHEISGRRIVPGELPGLDPRGYL